MQRPPACEDTDFPSSLSTSTRGLVSATTAPSLVPLTRGQVSAFVSVWSPFGQVCSGTMIGARTVLTAAHCVDPGALLSVRFGADGNRPGETRAVERLDLHPTLDIAVLRIETPTVPFTPLALQRDRITPARVGAPIEVAGFGASLDGFGVLGFLVTQVQSVRTTELEVQGAGRRGLCFGDSGGPLLVLDEARGDVRVAGVLTSGEVDCVGRDLFTLVEPAATFVRAVADDVVEQGPPTCEGGLTVEGACVGTTLRTCTDAGAVSIPCEIACGWGTEAYACLDTPDACALAEGACDGDMLSWCDRGVRRARDCAACGEVCEESATGAACRFSDCPAQPRCAGETVEWCDDSGRFRQLDCRRLGQRCAEDPARCEVEPGACEALGAGGACVDDVRVYCEGRLVRWERCALGCVLRNGEARCGV